MTRPGWLDGPALDAPTREALKKLDAGLLALWNLGDNVLLAWTQADGELLFLSVRHYAIPESVHAGADGTAETRFVNGVLSGPKQLGADDFRRVCRAFGAEAHMVRVGLGAVDGAVAALISGLVRRYGVSLVRDRAVMLLDAVEFSLQSPLDQMAMLNSLAYSVNSAYGQLLTKDIRIDFARTTTGDGFYIWNRATGHEANAELYKLMMMILADNAVAQRKARSTWVPKLRTAFHIGDHYEFHQVEGLNPTQFSYIVGEVTVDLARMVERALPGQILIGDFPVDGGSGDTAGFVEGTAATLDQLNGLDISGGRIHSIHCYLTGRHLAGRQYGIDCFRLRDKHGTLRTVYNAKINIHREAAEPIFLGLQKDDLAGFDAAHALRPPVVARQRA